MFTDALLNTIIRLEYYYFNMSFFRKCIFFNNILHDNPKHVQSIKMNCMVPVFL